MYNASIIINKVEFGASLVLGGNTYNANLVQNQPTFKATLSETIRMLPDVTLENRITELENKRFINLNNLP